MNVISIIAEYNPLHLGHQYQIEEARRLLGSDCAVMVAMSGCMTQRGEPAVLDKWSRTRMALACGADLVLELPFAYASASAERFASGGVRLLQATGLSSHLVFGSECGDLTALQRLAGLLASEPEDFRRQLHLLLDQGLSFPAARQKALQHVCPDPDLSGLLASSNNILAVEYLKAIQQSGQEHLTPLTIRRVGLRYRDERLQSGRLPSATAIRRTIAEHGRSGGRVPDLAGLLSKLSSAMPPPALAELLARIQSGPGPLFSDDCAAMILTSLLSRPPEAFDAVPGMEEGLGRRLAAVAARPGWTAQPGRPGLDRLLDEAATRRFTRTRMQRALLALLAGLTCEDLAAFDRSGGPQYIRVLGFRRKGRHLLKIMRRQALLPVMTRASDYLEHGGCPVRQRMFQLDLTATDLWMLAAGRSVGADFDTPVIML